MSVAITFKGHNIEVTDALRDLTTEKINKLEKHFDHITDISVTFDVQKLEQVAEATINVPGNQLHAKATTEDMYKSIDQMIDKLDKQIIKYKTKMQAKHADKPEFGDYDDQEAS